MIKAINPKHQKTIDKAYTFERKYHDVVNQQSQTDDERQLERLERQAEKHLNKAMEYWDMLPKTEFKNANKQYTAIHGYGI